MMTEAGDISVGGTGAISILRVLLRPLQLWVWRDTGRRARKLLRFAETEADGGRDLVRAAEVTPDPLLRRLFLFHARDEQRHADLFRGRGVFLLREVLADSRSGYRADWLAPGERGLDDLRIEQMEAGQLLAFLHLSEKTAVIDFRSYCDVLEHDPQTRSLFRQVLRDEAYHMDYTLSQLERVSRGRARLALWRARLSRVWKAYVRVSVALAGIISGLILTMLYFTVLVPFAWMAKRAARRDPSGWSPASPQRHAPLERQY
jgi:rubrerythrin